MRKQDMAKKPINVTPLQAIKVISAIKAPHLASDCLALINVLAGHMSGDIDKEFVIQLMKDVNINLIIED